jgi:hypothetical protein
MLQWKPRMWVVVGALAVVAGALGWLDGALRQLGW